MIAETVMRLRHEIGIPVDVARRGPVPLDRFFAERNVAHIALPGLTLGAVMQQLRGDGVPIEEFGNPDDRLAGFLFVAGRFGRAFVNADDILPRRRFTAAHELGHAVLHRERMGRFVVDATIGETDEATDELEREANQFAAELLMPEQTIRARADEMWQSYRACPRLVLAYQLASELLVSREAMRYRLRGLEVGDE